MELFRDKRIVAVGLALALGTAGCGGSKGHHESGRHNHPEKSLTTTTTVTPKPSIEVKYFPDGTRELIPKDPNFLPILQFCDAGVVVYETEAPGGDTSTQSGSVAIDSNSLVCQDDRLTPSDFDNQPNETVVTNH